MEKKSDDVSFDDMKTTMTISVKNKQRRWIKESGFQLSKCVQELIEKEMKKSVKK